jgi:hypothetical protein
MRLSLIERGVIAAAFVATSPAGTVASATVAELYAGSSHSTDEHSLYLGHYVALSDFHLNQGGASHGKK